MSVLNNAPVSDEVAAGPAAAAPRMTARQRAALLVLLGSTFLLAADLSLLNVAIPLIGRAMRIAVGDLQWIATAFTLTAAGLTLFFGRVADLLGRRRLFVGGMALLVLSSLLGGLANDPAVLIAARVGQGVATAMSTPAALALITASFPEGPLRARALGANGAMVSAGFTVGAVLSGLLTQLLSWRWAFLVNVPVGALIAVAAPFALAESRLGGRRRMDLPGAAAVSAALVCVVYGVSRAADLGWGAPAVLGFIVLGFALLALFWRIELRASSPLVSVRIIRMPTVRWGNFGGLVAIAMQTAVIFLTTLYLQEVVGYSAMATGEAFAVVGVAAFLGGSFAPRMIGRLGSRRALALGLVLQAVGPGGLFLLTASGRTPVAAALAVLCVGAFGHVSAVVSYMVTGTSGLDDETQGLAASLATMTQQVALAVGIPILSAVATSHIRVLSGAGSAAVLSGVRLALGVDACVLLAAIALLVVFLLRGKPVRSAGSGPA